MSIRFKRIAIVLLTTALTTSLIVVIVLTQKPKTPVNPTTNNPTTSMQGNGSKSNTKDKEPTTEKNTTALANAEIHEPDSFFSSQKGASSIEELLLTLNSSVLFNAKQVDCMSTLMIAWLFEEFQICDHFGITKEIVEQMSSQDLADLFNNVLNQDNIENSQLLIYDVEQVESEIIGNPDFIEQEAEAIKHDDFMGYSEIGEMFKQETLKYKVIDGAWKATNGMLSYTHKTDLTEKSYRDENTEPLLIFEIQGRYYWTAIEMY